MRQLRGWNQLKWHGEDLPHALQRMQTGLHYACRLESLQNAQDLCYVKIAFVAVFVSLNNSSIVSFCCFMKISQLKFKVCG